MNKVNFRRAIVWGILGLLACYAGSFYLYWRGTLYRGGRYLAPATMRVAQLFYYPMVVIDRPIEAWLDASRFSHKYAGDWVSEGQGSKATITIYKNLSYKFTVLHKGEWYSGEGDLVDAYPERHFSYFTDPSARVVIYIYDQSKDSLYDAPVMPRRIGVQVFVPSEGRVKGVGGLVRVK